MNECTKKNEILWSECDCTDSFKYITQKTKWGAQFYTDIQTKPKNLIPSTSQTQSSDLFFLGSAHCCRPVLCYQRGVFYQLLPVLCAECIRWSVNGLWAVHGFAWLRLRLVKVCCVSVVFKVALVRSEVHLKCDRGMQDVPFFFPLSRIDTMHQYISALYDYYLLYLDWYATNLELLVISLFLFYRKGSQDGISQIWPSNLSMTQC